MYRPGGGAYNVDSVLNVMVKGLEEELRERLSGGRKYLANAMSPSPQYESIGGIDDENWGLSNTLTARKELPLLRQGPSVSGLTKVAKQAGAFVLNRFMKEPKS